jgi:3-hydroxyacyl-CoA dehydrogenase/enoyl-CoA hydratase/3-hydroxybutyryl-CoA epimerase
VDALDGAMVRFGFPVGPCALLDEVGIDVAARVAGVMQRHFGERMAAPASMAQLVADGRKGRKAGRGFYTYDSATKKVDESVYALLPGGAARRPLDEHRVQQRLVFAFLNEVVRCLQDGVLRSPRDGDVGAVFGLGFPPFLGGPFRHLDRLGARFALETMEELRFEPAPLLVDLAREGRTFHAAGA